MRRIYIPFMNIGSKIPLVDLHVDGENLTALIDTGSESTLFDNSVTQSDNINISETDYTISLIGLSGETKRSRVMNVEAKVKIGDDGLEFNVNGMKSDLSSVSRNISERYGGDINVSVILGSDFLKTNNAKIDYRKQRMVIKR